jgi:hypothetical protein
MKKSFPLIAFYCAGALVAAQSVRAQSFTYNDFSSTAGLQLNGTATTTTGDAPTSSTVLRLTPANFYQAGSAFSTTQISLQNQASFSTAFSFQMGNAGGIGDEDGAGADGIMFVVQTVANNVGSSGGGIGYAGINHSLGVEFDTYNNGGSDGNGNHVAFNLNGVLTDTDLTAISTRMNNGAVWYAWVDYNGGLDDLQIRLSQTDVRPATPLIDANVDLQATLGQDSAYVGFTAGTGSGYEDQDIVNWQFNDSFQPIQTVGAPDSTATAGLLGIGLTGLAALRRRFRA